MVLYSNNEQQTLQPGSSLLITRISKCASCYSGTHACKCIQNCTVSRFTILDKAHTYARVKGSGNFIMSFSGNVAGVMTNMPVELSIAVNGNAVPTSKMLLTPQIADIFCNVSTLTGFKGNDFCDGATIAIINTGDMPVKVAAHAALTIWRA